MFDRAPIQCSKNVLDYLATRQRVVASNVANINTPGYKTRDVSFDSVLENKNNGLRLKLATTNARHMTEPFEEIGGIETFYAYGSQHKNDGANDVDLDKEMLKLGEIQTNFSIFSETLKRKYQSIKNVIAGAV